MSIGGEESPSESEDGQKGVEEHQEELRGRQHHNLRQRVRRWSRRIPGDSSGWAGAGPRGD